MKHVSIYIETQFKGRPNDGTGKYIVLLEFILSSGAPFTKQYEFEVMHTTANRLCILATLCGLSHLTTECEVDLFTNNTYLAETIHQERFYEWALVGWMTGNKEVKNRDLWEQMIEYADKHMIRAQIKKATSYTRVLQTRIETMAAEQITDRLEDHENV